MNKSVTPIPELVLSLFPGIGLLDLAFEQEGYSIVRGPDLLWGGDIKNFHVPAERFDGVIGGPPCQAFSRLRHIVEANGHTIAPNLIPEFERIVGEAKPKWFLMENVPDAPLPIVLGYTMSTELIEDVMVGGQTSRCRRFSFGSQVGLKLRVEIMALWSPSPERTVTCDPRTVPVAFGAGRRPKGGGRMPHVGRSMSIGEMCKLQGLPETFTDWMPFTVSAKRRVIGNGVPLAMGKAIARAVRKAITK